MSTRSKPLSRRPARAPRVRESAAAPSRVGVRELRQNLSVYLDRVKRGEALTVTEHGRDVALLRPLPPAIDLVERLAAEGRVARPARSLRNLPKPVRVRLRTPVSRLLLEMREDERF